MAELEAGNHYDPGNPRHVEWVRKQISTQFLRGARFFACYMDDGTPVGLASLLINEGPDGVTDCWRSAELLDIGIFDEFQGKGHGAKLLKHVEDFAREAGVYCLWMLTYAHNCQAISFYGRNEYVPVGALPDVHGPHDEGIVFMRKVLLSAE